MTVKLTHHANGRAQSSCHLHVVMFHDICQHLPPVVAFRDSNGGDGGKPQILQDTYKKWLSSQHKENCSSEFKSNTNIKLSCFVCLYYFVSCKYLPYSLCVSMFSWYHDAIFLHFCLTLSGTNSLRPRSSSPLYR